MKKEVQIIAANKDKVNRKFNSSFSKVRVAPYCRVNTNSEEQKTSYDSQLMYYKDLVEKNDEWELVDMYADEAISGTQTLNRTDFQRMINDAVTGKKDNILTKSISRFARNTLDTLKYVRLLKEKNIATFFEKENINTMTMNGELLLVILGSAAQQESESISGNVKIGLKMKMKRGELVGFNKCYGYDYDKETQTLTINEEESEIVRFIFERYISGAGAFVIARELNTMQVPSPKTKGDWGDSTVRGILKNEKYKGDLLLGKTFTVDPITHRRLQNFGEVKKYYVNDHHDPIVTEEQFEKVQQIILKRRNLLKLESKRSIYSRKFPFSSIVKCGFCGATCSKRTWHSSSSYYKTVWTCITHTRKGKIHCPHSKSVDDEVLKEAFVAAYNHIYKSNNKLIANLLQTIEKTISTNSILEEQEKINAKMESTNKKIDNLLDMKLSNEIDQETYQSKVEKLKIELFKLKASSDELQIYSNRDKEAGRRIQQFKKVFEQNTVMKEFDSEIFELLVDKVIFGETLENGEIEPYNIRFIFKTGESIDTNIEKNDKIKKNKENIDLCSTTVDDSCGDSCLII